jgi:hypothetical protein
VILSDVGFKDMMYQLMQRYVCPLAALLYKEQGGAALDRLHSFVVFTPLSLSRSSSCRPPLGAQRTDV